jgi:hypothetical protein
MAWDGNYGENEYGGGTGVDADTGTATQKRKAPAGAQPVDGASKKEWDDYTKSVQAKAARGEATPEELAWLNSKGAPTQAIAPGWNGPVTSSTGPNSLSALRDKFLAERDGVGHYDPGRIGANPAERSALEEARGRQLQHLDTLQGVASGVTPGVADAQRRAAVFDSTQSALGNAAAAAPTLGAGAFRATQRAVQEGGRRSGLDAGLIAAQEQAAARGQIGTVLDQVRGLDQTLAISDAERAQRGEGLSVDAALKGRQLYIDERAGLGKLGLDAEGTASTTRLNEAKIEDMRAQLDFAYAQLAQAKSESERNRWFGVIGSILGGAAAVGSAAATGGA